MEGVRIRQLRRSYVQLRVVSLIPKYIRRGWQRLCYGYDDSRCACGRLKQYKLHYVIGSANGTGNGTVNFTVAANPGVQRSRTITIAGLTFTVTQDAVAAAPMQFSTATFTGSEASGIASITVNRTGDTPVHPPSNI